MKNRRINLITTFLFPVGVALSAAGLVLREHFYSGFGGGVFSSGPLANLVLYIGLGCILVSLVVAVGTTKMTQKTARTGVVFGIIAILMLWFSYFLVVGFDVVCHHLGINGKLNENGEVVVNSAGDSAKLADVMVTTTNNAILPLEYKVVGNNKQQVKPGQDIKYQMQVINPRSRSYHVRVQLSVVPGTAARYIAETTHVDGHSFTIGPNSKVLLPLHLRFSKALPVESSNVVLSYTFYDTSRHKNLKRGEIKDLIDGSATR